MEFDGVEGGTLIPTFGCSGLTLLEGQGRIQACEPFVQWRIGLDLQCCRHAYLLVPTHTFVTWGVSTRARGHHSTLTFSTEQRGMQIRLRQSPSACTSRLRVM